jgi:predicted glycoside hydrolase/deacetylase ChbG (UPF0249 family)
VNAGILTAHREGILTAATLMATGAAFEDAVRLAREAPALDIGCHLVVVGSEPFPATVPALMRALLLRRVRVYDELRSQVAKIVSAGIAPSHLDTHKHTHLLPPVLEAVARISEEFHIPWVRRPFDFPMEAGGVPYTRRAVSRGLGMLRQRVERTLMAHHCRMTDHFAGFRLTGHYDAAELALLIRNLPEGSTEFMCHPGYATAELRSARTRLKESRAEELKALTSPLVKQALRESGVELVTYRELR